MVWAGCLWVNTVQALGQLLLGCVHVLGVSTVVEVAPSSFPLVWQQQGGEAGGNTSICLLISPFLMGMDFMASKVGSLVTISTNGCPVHHVQLL